MPHRPARAAARLLALALTLALTGCASIMDAPGPEDVISGRLSVQVPADANQAARGFNGQFDLRGSPSAGRLDIAGPLGAGAVRATWSAGQYSLDNGQDIRHYASLDELAEGGLGERLPLAALFDWLRGRPWPGAPSQSTDDGRIGFVQLGWRIDTAEEANGRIRAQRLTPPHIQLRIVLDARPGS